MSLNLLHEQTSIVTKYDTFKRLSLTLEMSTNTHKNELDMATYYNKTVNNHTTLEQKEQLEQQRKEETMNNNIPNNKAHRLSISVMSENDTSTISTLEIYANKDAYDATLKPAQLFVKANQEEKHEDEFNNVLYEQYPENNSHTNEMSEKEEVIEQAKEIESPIDLKVNKKQPELLCSNNDKEEASMSSTVATMPISAGIESENMNNDVNEVLNKSAVVKTKVDPKDITATKPFEKRTIVSRSVTKITIFIIICLVISIYRDNNHPSARPGLINEVSNTFMSAQNIVSDIVIKPTTTLEKAKVNDADSLFDPFTMKMNMNFKEIQEEKMKLGYYHWVFL